MKKGKQYSGKIPFIEWWYCDGRYWIMFFKECDYMTETYNWEHFKTITNIK